MNITQRAEDGVGVIELTGVIGQTPETRDAFGSAISACLAEGAVFISVDLNGAERVNRSGLDMILSYTPRVEGASGRLGVVLSRYMAKQILEDPPTSLPRIDLRFDNKSKAIAALRDFSRLSQSAPAGAIGDATSGIERKIHHAFVAALVVGVFGLFGVIIGMAVGAEGDWADPWSLIDVAIAFGLAIGIRKRSRSAAVAMLVYYTISKIVLSFETGAASLIWILIFGYWFVQGIQGTFAFHRLHRLNGPIRRTRKWVYFAVGPISAIALLLVIVGAMVETGYLPDTQALPGDEIKAPTLSSLVDLGVIGEGEEVQYFFSDAFWSVKTEGNLFTSERIISYEKIDGELCVYAAPFDSVTSMFVYYSDSYWDDTILEVQIALDSTFILVISTEDGGDRAFIEKMQEFYSGELVDARMFEEIAERSAELTAQYHSYTIQWDSRGVERGQGWDQRTRVDEAASLVAEGRTLEAWDVYREVISRFEESMDDRDRIYVSVASSRQFDAFRARNDSGKEPAWIDWSLREAYQQLTYVACASGDDNLALDLLRQQIDYAPFAAEPFLERGHILLDQGDALGALNAFETALMRSREFGPVVDNGRDGLAWSGLTEACIVLKRFDEAQEYASEWIRFDPNNDSARDRLKHIAELRRKPL